MALKLVSRNEIPKLMNVLKSHLPYSCSIYNWLRMHGVWERKMTNIKVQVLCPDGDIRSGAVVAFCQGLMQEDQVYMSAFCDKKNVQLLSRALENTTLVPWSKLAYVLEVVDPLAEPMRDILSSKINKFSEGRCNFFYMPNEIAIKHFDNIKIPDSVRVGLLQEEHVENLCRGWMPFTETFRPVVQAMVRYNPSVGVYMEDKLAMSCLENQNGGMGIGYTIPEFRNSGLATLGILLLGQAMARQGSNLHFWIAQNNKISDAVMSRKVDFGKPVTQCSQFLCFKNALFK